MRIEHVRALSFDCYGTLVDWESGLVRFFGEWIRRHGLDVEPEAMLPRFSAHETRLEESSPTAPYRQVLEGVLEGLALELGVTLSSGEAATLPESLRDWPLFPDSEPFLRRAREKRTLAMISNVDDELFAATRERLGVVFDVVVTAESVGAYKPSPAGFRRCLELLGRRGIESREVLHVAQSLYHDHVPAKRLGLRTCWVDRRAGRDGWGATPPPPETVQPDVRVVSLADLATML